MSPSGDLANLLERVTKTNEENFEFGPTTEKRTGVSHSTDDVASLENQRGLISDLHNFLLSLPDCDFNRFALDMPFLL